MNVTEFLDNKFTQGAFTGIATNSANVATGELFFALSKNKETRAKSIAQALSRGAKNVITYTEDSDHIANSDVIYADELKSILLSSLRKFYLPTGNMPSLFAITGTNGKSSTAYYLYQILESCGRKAAFLGTTGGHIHGKTIPSRLTTPDVSDFYKFVAQANCEKCDSLVFEYSSHALHQNRLLDIKIPYATFTNLTPDHLDYHQTMENYYQAKRKLFTEYVDENNKNYAVINADDQYGVQLLDDNSIPRTKISYGFAQKCDFRLHSHSITPDGTQFQASWQGNELNFQTHLLGLPNIYNIAAASTNALLLGIPTSQLISSVNKLQAVPGRFETVKNNRGYRIIIDYAHTPDALEKLLINVRSITPGKIICVFGCGGNRDTTKRPLMGAIAEKFSDTPIITSDNPRNENPDAIISQIAQGFIKPGSAEKISCRRSAIQRAVEIANPGDSVVIAGKGHEATQEINEKFYPFLDKSVVLEILEGTA